MAFLFLTIIVLTGIGQGSTSVPGFPQTDPTIDLELDVKVSINSGECVLFNKDFAKDDGLVMFFI